MSDLTRLRVLFYCVVITMHVSNVLYMKWFASRSEKQDEMALNFKSLQYRYFTTWTYMLQTIYSIFGLVCDVFLMKNSKKKNYQLPKAVTNFREMAFAGLVWPSTLVVFTVFWGLYAIDRALIYPEYLDSIIPSISNHVMHTMILPVALLEVAFRPRPQPETHARNIAQLLLHLIVYLSVLIFTYVERGIWLYPIFRKVYGTIYLPLVLAGAAVLFFIFYYIQWPLTKMLHSSKHKQTKKVQAVDKKKKVKKN